MPDLDALALAGPIQDGEGNQTTRVRCVSLDEYLVHDPLPIDFAKMDVEGAEGDVLEGAQHVLNTYHPLMMIELHSVGRAINHPVVCRLREMGYSIELLGEANYTARTLARWADNPTS